VNTQLLVAVVLAVGAPAFKPAPRPPAPPTLHGEWVVASFVADGRPEDCLGMTVEFATTGRMTFRYGGKVHEELGYSTAPGKEVAELDWVENGGRHRLLGISEFAGDALIICVRMDPAGSRPTAFEAPSGSDRALLTLKRAKKKD
jgi:uncharacterized protein (TIGR03067 family)